MGQEGPHCGAAGRTAPERAGIVHAGLAFGRLVADARVKAADVKTISHASEIPRELRSAVQPGEES